MSDTVPLERRPRHFGGYSFYFRCPGLRGTGCGRRVLKLYLMHNEFRCRYCHQLVYCIASKAYVARRHLAMPASTDYWINDLAIRCS
jgi:hypothetical protein